MTAEQRREDYEAGRALGELIAAAIKAAHNKKHVQQDWDNTIKDDMTYCQNRPTGTVNLLAQGLIPCADAMARIDAACTINSKRSFCAAYAAIKETKKPTPPAP